MNLSLSKTLTPTVDGMEKFEDIKVRLKKQNRIESRTANFRQHWCNRCDRNIVACGATCSECGYRQEKQLKHFEITD
jgi:hypothetical protein